MKNRSFALIILSLFVVTTLIFTACDSGSRTETEPPITDETPEAT